MQKYTKKVIISSSGTLGLSSAEVHENHFEHRLNAKDDYAVYLFDLRPYKSLIPENAVISKIELQYSHYRCEGELEFACMPDWNRTYGYQSVNSKDRRSSQVTLNGYSSVAFRYAMDNDDVFSVGVRPRSDGIFRIGGQDLIRDDASPWIPAEGLLASPPKIVITYEVLKETDVEFAIRYTTLDATSMQHSPMNSMGGYPSLNSLPNISADKIAGMWAEKGRIIHRGLNPFNTGPASIDPRKEFHYLNIDHLFDVRPTAEKDQYRCLAVVYLSQKIIHNVKIGIKQDRSANVTFHAGVEVPKFDTHFGKLSHPSDGTLLVDSENFSEFETGFFNDASVVLGDMLVTIASFDVEDGVATFILDRDIGPIPKDKTFRINPAPCQIVKTDARPAYNEGRFFGFFEDKGSIPLDINNIRRRGSELHQYDTFYVWIKRMARQNVSKTHARGAALTIEFEE